VSGEAEFEAEYIKETTQAGTPGATVTVSTTLVERSRSTNSFRYVVRGTITVAVGARAIRKRTVVGMAVEESSMVRVQCANVARDSDDQLRMEAFAKSVALR
jgi:hypothetical protein